MALLTVILGAVMVASSLGAKLVGLPRQAVRNYQRKTAPHAMRWFPDSPHREMPGYSAKPCARDGCAENAVGRHPNAVYCSEKCAAAVYSQRRRAKNAAVRAA